MRQYTADDYRKKPVVIAGVYHHRWEDGRSVGKYIVTDIAETDYGIIWSSAAMLRVRFGCPLNANSQRVNDLSPEWKLISDAMKELHGRIDALKALEEEYQDMLESLGEGESDLGRIQKDLLLQCNQLEVKTQQWERLFD